MHFADERPDNWPVGAYLKGEADSYVVISAVTIPPKRMHDAYWGCGSHPEIVERVWEVLGEALPSDSRAIINGHPSLLHPESGVVLAICMGTSYCIRIPLGFHKEALRQNLRQSFDWGGQDEATDLKKKFGDDWFFGSFVDDELTWCLRAYESF